MSITEPATVLTDYAIAIEATLFAVRLFQSQRWAVRLWAVWLWAVWLWAIAFIAVAIAALLGGTFHGFGTSLAYETQLWLWKPTLICLGIASWSLALGTVLVLAPVRSRLWLGALVCLKLGVYFYWIARYNHFGFGVVDYLLGLLVVLLLAILRLNHQPCSRWLIAGVGVSGVAALILWSGDRSGLNLSAIYHVVQMAALYLFYRGVKQFQQATQLQRL
ncbi:MAG: hypothetical protein HC881_23050 [Leptolyngbyaceae cyanobacterium SL_7_1]|nr:hypothetical protein [Leptolyngbyaceae cyanobacterium SL_7_1]